MLIQREVLITTLITTCNSVKNILYRLAVINNAVVWYHHLVGEPKSHLVVIKKVIRIF